MPAIDYEKLLDDRKALEAHFTQQQYDRKLLVAFAFRSALRVLPVLGKTGEFSFWSAKDLKKHSQAIFKALEFSRDYANGTISKAGWWFDDDNAYHSYAYSAATYTYNAAYYDDTAYYAAIAAADAKAAYAAARATIAGDLAALASKNITTTKLLAQPLWLTLPDGWADVEAGFENALISALGKTKGKSHYKYYVNWATPKTPHDLSKSVAITATNADKPAVLDSLGRTPLVKALAAFCDHPEHTHPNIIALLGDWGAGKSSVIRQLKYELGLEQHHQQAIDTKKLEHEFLYAELNAWEYENTKNMDAALAQETIKGLTKHYKKGRLKKLWFPRRLLLLTQFNRRERSYELRRILFGAIVAAFVVGLIILAGYLDLPPEILEALGIDPQKPNIESSLLGGGSALVLAFIAQLWLKWSKLVKHPLSTELFTFFDTPSYEKHMGILPAIRRQLHTLLTLRMYKRHYKLPEWVKKRFPHFYKKDHRLLVVVDDLDRCKPKTINNTLDAYWAKVLKMS